MEENVSKAVLKEKLIAIVRGVEKEKLIPTAEALYAGGVRLLEITFSATGAPSDAETAESIAMLVKHFAGRMHIGAGTVLSAEQVERVAEAGGRFIISPDTNAAVIERTKQLGLVSIPGALTPTEVQTAHRAGADFIKLFPVEGLGTAYVKAISAPLSHIKFLAVGGVNEENMASFLQAGVCGFGISSGMVNRKLIEEGNYDAVTELAKKYVAVLTDG